MLAQGKFWQAWARPDLILKELRQAWLRLNNLHLNDGLELTTLIFFM